MIDGELVDFSKMNFARIKEIENEISSKKENALLFINNPDKYMKEKLRGTYVPSDVHFHVRTDKAIFPDDDEQPEVQIVITTVIELDNSFKSDVIAEFDRINSKSSIGIRYCEGCRKCKIAIIR